MIARIREGVRTSFVRPEAALAWRRAACFPSILPAKTRWPRPEEDRAMLDWDGDPYWLALGLMGNLAFGSRFVVQWIASERAGESIVPKLFWYLSIGGTLILLAYALHLRSVVFSLAFFPNCYIYIRNLVLIQRKERSLTDAGTDMDSLV
jgi:lipid-A-disaccharide synthase-like uncharacterized protein